MLVPNTYKSATDPLEVTTSKEATLLPKELGSTLGALLTNIKVLGDGGDLPLPVLVYLQVLLEFHHALLEFSSWL